MTAIKKFLSSIWTLPFIAAGLIVLIATNEISYDRSKIAVTELEAETDVRLTLQTLMSKITDAEAGQRGYLLMGQDAYLAPYTQATQSINALLDRLRTHLATNQQKLAQFAVLSRAISRKLAELELSIALKKGGQDIGWRAVIDSDHGRQYMEDIRAASMALTDSLDNSVKHSRAQIRNTLLVSRLAIFAAVLISALAFTLYFIAPIGTRGGR
jgi:CHASE3 domain sensor protein